MVQVLENGEQELGRKFGELTKVTSLIAGIALAVRRMCFKFFDRDAYLFRFRKHTAHCARRLHRLQYHKNRNLAQARISSKSNPIRNAPHREVGSVAPLCIPSLLSSCITYSGNVSQRTMGRPAVRSAFHEELGRTLDMILSSTNIYCVEKDDDVVQNTIDCLLVF